MYLYFLTVAFFCFIYANGMPYRVPLQGIEGKFRTLVLSDDINVKYSHSIFFDDLKSRGHQIVFSNDDTALTSFGEYLYDNIILFAPKKQDFTSITIEDLKQFFDEGGDILFIADREVSDSFRVFAAMCGVEFDKKGTAVIDHFAYEESLDQNGLHTTVLANEYSSLPWLGDQKTILFRGIGHVIDNNNVLANRVLKGNPTTYSADPSTAIVDYPENAGRDTSLVSAVQGRNNARLIFSGSSELFSNSFFVRSENNREFSASISKWVFGESGVLRFRDVQHNKIDGTPPDVILHEKERPDLPQSLYPDPEITRNSLVYRIKDVIVYSMIVEEYKDGKWTPFNPNDMQMEFVMLDPHVRKTMSCSNGKCSAVFTAPDNYGIFKFRVFYRRPGYSVLHAETQVSIRPFKHNEYERFIFSAYPYYSSALSALVAFLVLTVCFLFTSEK